MSTARAEAEKQLICLLCGGPADHAHTDGPCCGTCCANWGELANSKHLSRWISRIRVHALSLTERLATIEATLLDWENREAAVCPEDVGFEEYIGVLRKKLATVEAENRWVKVEEGLPEPSLSVLVACYTMRGKWTEVAHWRGGDPSNWTVAGGVRVKFWRPLPSPPTEGKDNERG